MEDKYDDTLRKTTFFGIIICTSYHTVCFIQLYGMGGLIPLHLFKENKSFKVHHHVQMAIVCPACCQALVSVRSNGQAAEICLEQRASLMIITTAKRIHQFLKRLGKFSENMPLI